MKKILFFLFAEDYGSTEADNVRYAIQKALDAIFAQPRY